MGRRKNVLMVTAGILIGLLMAGPGVSAVETFLQAYPSTNTFYLDGQQIQMHAYVINGNNYVKLADIGKTMDFNVYWDGTVQIESGAPYTGKPTTQTTELEEVRQEMIQLINEVRRENGVSELTVDQRLMAAAQECSSRKYTYHQNKEECEEVIAQGYPHGFGNNLCILTAAAPADIAQRAVTSWVNSPGHFRAMVDARGDSLGVGVTLDNGVAYCYMFVGMPGTHNPYE